MDRRAFLSVLGAPLLLARTPRKIIPAPVAQADAMEVFRGDKYVIRSVSGSMGEAVRIVIEPGEWRVAPPHWKPVRISPSAT